MIAKIKRAKEFADVIEVRFDCLTSDQIDPTFAMIDALQISRQLIATFRPVAQGGRKDVSLGERKEFWQKTHERCFAADVEEDVFPFAASWKRRIASFHDFDGGSVNLNGVFEALSNTDADVIKMAVTVDDISDSIPVWNLRERAKDGKKIVPIAMGEAGKWTRILGLAHGAFLTYASLDDGDKTAPGQISARDLIETYRIKELDLETTVYGVIGDPVSESLSPYMHNGAFAEQKVNAVFIPLQVRDLNEFICRMVKRETREVELNFNGFSVTMPHKQAIIKHLDSIDAAAENIGAVNTVKIENDKLIGYNTDAYGFITPLKELYGDLKGANVFVFGAGGAARACAFGLKQEGGEVTIVARNKSKADQVANELGVRSGQLDAYYDPTADIVVNATPLGMKGELENDCLFTAEQLEGVKFIYDLVTRADDTPLIREAKKANIPAIGGIEMLLHQGAKQFEIWTGQTAPIGKIKAALTKKIQQTQK